jgi:hypothetical protein
MTLPWARNVFAVLILLIGSGTTVFGQEYDPTGQRSLNGQLLHSPDYLPFTHLTLELSISKKDCLQLEPILFTTTLRNQTKRSIVDHGGLSFDYGALEIYVQSPGKEQHQIPTLTRRKIDSMVSPWVMEPGALVPSTEMFFVGLDEIFP